MGTSSSHKGINPAAPEPNNKDKNIIEQEPVSFRGFRTCLGKFAKDLDQEHLTKAFSHYSRSGNGGSLSAFSGTISNNFADTYKYLSQNIIVSKEALEVERLFSNELDGLSLEEAAGKIIQKVCPHAGIPENEIVRKATYESLSNILNRFKSITSEELLDEFFRSYFSSVVWLSIEWDSDNSLSLDNINELVKAEQMLKDEVHAVVQTCLNEKFSHINLSSLSKIQLKSVSEKLISLILKYFENKSE